MRRIALLTDFGTRDPYVAAMKGVFASRTTAPVHDLAHDLPPFDILGGAWFLRSVAPYWPTGTIFVAVVDPGVGTSRQIVALEEDGRTFLAPDNGLLTFVWHGTRAHAVTNEKLFLPGGSTTFHGRDRFAPVAAALANGTALAELGPPLDRLVTLDYQPPHYAGDFARGTIVAIDRFGNAITDLERARVPFAPFALRMRDVRIDRIEANYGDAAPGAFLIIGSTGCVEISVANASAAERLQLRRLERVELRPV
ncbi:MAG: SAM-dependent chlorinase/fluorinase [Acidobacteria bacterium]|nr:SAM-dependent chlorinase/fluorinase [Acidobacteriota bacterium]MBV9474958.1 SAM-dependent chlorinase/fluorinase [Acidobacteriota bacterium]